jgi:hypothetical protein
MVLSSFAFMVGKSRYCLIISKFIRFDGGVIILIQVKGEIEFYSSRLPESLIQIGLS